VIELGYADPAHIGLQNHNWGGYQSSFIVPRLRKGLDPTIVLFCRLRASLRA